MQRTASRPSRGQVCPRPFLFPMPCSKGPGAIRNRGFNLSSGEAGWFTAHEEPCVLCAACWVGRLGGKAMCSSDGAVELKRLA